MKILAPAKINIILRVLGRRPNGYHDLFMLNEKLDLCDEIEIVTTDKPSHQNTGTPEHQISIACDDPNVPCDETNLCYKAARALLCHSESELVEDEESHKYNCVNEILRSHPLPQNDISVHIHIEKRIPVAAGLGGGSSDAAATLKGLNELLGLGLSREKLAGLGVKLGADVPFFLYEGPAICEGIGDKIITLDGLPNMWILLINPNFPVSTKWVYKEFDHLQLTEQNRDVSSFHRNFKGLDDVVRVIHNDLELVTSEKFPEIKNIKHELADNGALVSWMSGSGPTVVGMFESEKSRNLAFEELNRPEWRVIKTANF